MELVKNLKHVRLVLIQLDQVLALHLPLLYHFVHLELLDNLMEVAKSLYHHLLQNHVLPEHF